MKRNLKEAESTDIFDKDSKVSDTDNKENDFDINSKRKKQPAFEGIKTFCRIRPTQPQHKNYEIYKVNDPDKKVLTINADEKTLKNLEVSSSSFTFTRIFEEDSSQNEIYDVTCKQQVKLLLNEFQSSLIFTYGITNAGKTYTVIGTPEKPGILPNMINDIYSQLKELIERNPGRDYLFCNFVEIYGEEIFDLLNPDVPDQKDITWNNNSISINNGSKKGLNNENLKKKIQLKERDKKFILQCIIIILLINYIILYYFYRCLRL